MSDYKTDDEKVEELKAWWKANGTSVAAGIALAIVALFGWEYWKNSKESTAIAASELFNSVEKTANTDLAKAVPLVEKLQNDYASTPYAAMASLKAAQRYAANGDNANATKALQWAVDNSKEPELTYVAQLRLARLLVSQNKLDDAQKIIGATYPAAYTALIEELKGDIFYAQKKLPEARAAYDKAIVTSKGDTDVLKMKRANLGEGV